MALLPFDALFVAKRHRAWGNVAWAVTTRVYAFSAARLRTAAKATGAPAIRGVARFLEAFETGVVPPLSATEGRTLGALVAGSNAIAVAIRFAVTEIDYVRRSALALELDGYPRLRDALECRRRRTFGTPFAPGRPPSREIALEDAQAFDALRVPFPDLRQTIAELEVSRMAEICAPSAVHAIPLEPVLDFVRGEIRDLGTTHPRLGVVPASSRACAQLARALGGTAEAARAVIGARIGGDRGARISLGASAAPTATPCDTAIEDAAAFNLAAFAHVSEVLDGYLAQGYTPALFGAIRPDREGMKARAFNVFPWEVAWAARFVRPLLTVVRRIFARGPTLDHGVSRRTLTAISGRLREASRRNPMRASCPDGTRSTDAIEHALLRVVCEGALDAAGDEVFDVWGLPPRDVKDFCRRALATYTQPSRSIVFSSFTRLAQFETCYQAGDFTWDPEEPARRDARLLECRNVPPAFPAFEGRVLGRVHRPTVIVGRTGSGKSVGAVLDALSSRHRVVVVEPRRVAVTCLIADVKRHAPGVPLGIAIGGNHAHERVTVATAGACLGLIRQDSLIILDEAHEDGDAYDFVRAKAAAACVPLVEVTATPLARHARLERIEIGRHDGLARTVVRRPPFRSFEAALDAGMAFARDGGLRVLVIRPGIADATATAAKIGGLVLHGAMGAEAQAAVATDESRAPIVATLIAASSVTIPNVEVVVTEGYTWADLFDPLANVTSLARAQMPAHTLEQIEGRAARAVTDGRPLVAHSFVALNERLPVDVGTIASSRAGYADLSPLERDAYRIDIAPAYLAAALHDAPLTPARFGGGGPGPRALKALARASTCEETRRTILAECALRHAGFPSAAARARAHWGAEIPPAVDEFLQLAARMSASARRAADACADYELARGFSTEWDVIDGVLLTTLGPFLDVLPEEVAIAYPAELTVVSADGRASFVTRPSVVWETKASPGTYLAHACIARGAREVAMRRVSVSNETLAKARACVGLVYAVAGDPHAPVAALSEAATSSSVGPGQRTKSRLTVVTHPSPRVDVPATVAARAAQLASVTAALYEAIAAHGITQPVGSSQSHVCSFEVLNILTGLACTRRGLELAQRFARDFADALVAAGVPRAALDAFAYVSPDGFSDIVAQSHGDDRIVVSASPEIFTAVPTAMLVIGRCGISPKSGSAVFDGSPAMATFCAHGVDEGGVHVVSALRRALAAQRGDGIAPSATPGPSWPLAFTGVDDPLAAMHAQVAAERDPRAPYYTAFAQKRVPNDGYGLVRELESRGMSRGEAFGVALATHKMPSVAGEFLSVDEAVALADLAGDVSFDSFDSFDADEGHLRVYDLVE